MIGNTGRNHGDSNAGQKRKAQERVGAQRGNRTRCHRPKNRPEKLSSSVVCRGGDRLYLLPVTGSDSAWFKNILNNPRITISAKGQNGEFTAEPVQDPNIVASVVDKFRKKYGASEVKKYYSKFDVAVIVDLK